MHSGEKNKSLNGPRVMYDLISALYEYSPNGADVTWTHAAGREYSSKLLNKLFSDFRERYGKKEIDKLIDHVLRNENEVIEFLIVHRNTKQKKSVDLEAVLQANRLSDVEGQNEDAYDINSFWRGAEDRVKVRIGFLSAARSLTVEKVLRNTSRAYIAGYYWGNEMYVVAKGAWFQRYNLSFDARYPLRVSFDLLMPLLDDPLTIYMAREGARVFASEGQKNFWKHLKVLAQHRFSEKFKFRSAKRNLTFSSRLVQKYGINTFFESGRISIDLSNPTLSINGVCYLLRLIERAFQEDLSFSESDQLFLELAKIATSIYHTRLDEPSLAMKAMLKQGDFLLNRLYLLTSKSGIKFDAKTVTIDCHQKEVLVEVQYRLLCLYERLILLVGKSDRQREEILQKILEVEHILSLPRRKSNGDDLPSSDRLSPASPCLFSPPSPVFYDDDEVIQGINLSSSSPLGAGRFKPLPQAFVRMMDPYDQEEDSEGELLALAKKRQRIS